MSFIEPLFAAAFSLLGSPVTWLEIVALALSLWMVVCNMRVNALAWPLAIAASLLYGLLFANSKLYGEAGLQVFFMIIAAWGWWQWRFGTQDGGAPLVVRHLDGSARGVRASRSHHSRRNSPTRAQRRPVVSPTCSASAAASVLLPVLSAPTIAMTLPCFISPSATRRASRPAPSA